MLLRGRFGFPCLRSSLEQKGEVGDPPFVSNVRTKDVCENCDWGRGGGILPQLTGILVAWASAIAIAVARPPWAPSAARGSCHHVSV